MSIREAATSAQSRVPQGFKRNESIAPNNPDLSGDFVTWLGAYRSHRQWQDIGRPTVASSAAPKVTAVTGQIEIGRTITVDVAHLSNWAANHDPRKLVPYLNGRALNGLYPEEVNLSENRLLFHLLRTSDSKKEWENLLHEPVLRRSVSFSVGLEHQSPFDTVFDYDNRLTLTVIPKTWGMISLAVVLGILILLVYLSTRTNILRDPGPRPATGKYRPYDLGRVQTAFWFFLISTSYLCIWLITGDLDTVTPTTLVLMGISAITALGPRLVRAASDDIDQPVATQDSSTSGSASKGFFTDILSDANGYSFHRPFRHGPANERVIQGRQPVT